MSSTPPRLQALLILLCAVALAGCSSPGAVVEGKALEREGMQSSGAVGSLHAKVGETCWIALPVPSNTSAEPIEVTDVAVEHIPDDIRLVEYAAYDRNDTEGLPSWRVPALPTPLTSRG